MKEVYLLVPLLTSPNSRIEPDVERILAIGPQQYQIYQFDEDKYAIQLPSLNLGYQELVDTLEQYQHIKNKLSLIEQSLKQYEWNPKETSMHTTSIDSLMKKAIKYKESKEENKKLKKLLQHQLQNTEKVREQTQKTMHVLRAEFDTLVREMNKSAVEPQRPSTASHKYKGHQKHHHHKHQVRS